MSPNTNGRSRSTGSPWRTYTIPRSSSSVLPELEPIAVGPEAAEPGRAGLAPQSIELRERRVRDKGGEIRAIARDRRGVVERGSRVVRGLPVRPAQSQTGAGQLEQPEPARSPRREVALEEDAGGVQASGSSFDPSPR